MVFDTTLTPDQIAAFTRQGYWRGRLITDQLDDCVAARPDGTAVIDSRAEVTWREIGVRVDRAARGLLALGVRPGDVVSVQLPNWSEFLVAHLAACRIGAVTNPVVPTFRERELEFMLGLAEAKVVVVPRVFRGHDYPGMYRALRDRLPALGHVVIVGDPGGEPDAGPGELAWRDLLRLGATATPAVRPDDCRPDPNDVTLLIYTSGTTGEPKGVMHTHNTLGAAISALPGRLGLDASSVLHTASTLGHLTGLLYCARLALQLGGATAVYQDVWRPEAFADLVQRHHISFTSGATPFLHDTLEVASRGQHDMSSLTRFCCMGAPIPRALLRAAARQLPGLVTVGGWGQTENSMVTVSSPKAPEEKIAERDGFPLPGMRVRVIGPDSAPLPVGGEGRLQVAGAFLFVGYLKRLDVTRKLYSGEWFDTGDLATVDGDGYLSITGRTKDIIVRGGENLPVAYIENVLHEDPRIRVAALVGVPDPRLGERACAVVIPADGAARLSLPDITQFLAGQGVARNYWPERLAIVDDVPRTPSGKVQKFRLRQLIESGALPVDPASRPR
ncbi:MAG TPA: AMP-binding protein [Trebonia sp.]|nr:AMP-binding protein [Trebonia sp.]